MFTQWEYEIDKEVLRLQKERGEEEKGIQLKPSPGWGGNPLTAVLKPSFLPRRIKRVYRKEDETIMNMTDSAFRPEKDIFERELGKFDKGIEEFEKRIREFKGKKDFKEEKEFRDKKKELEKKNSVVIAVAGLSNALSGMLAGVSTIPVITCPPNADNLLSSLRMPSGIAHATVLGAGNAALFAAKIIGRSDASVRRKVAEALRRNARVVEDADAELR